MANSSSFGRGGAVVIFQLAGTTKNFGRRLGPLDSGRYPLAPLRWATGRIHERRAEQPRERLALKDGDNMLD